MVGSQLELTQLKTYIENLKEELIHLRHILHSLAEPSWKEFKTTEFIASFIANEDLEWKSFEGLATGGYVDIVFDSSRPFLSFRADIDALPIKDNPHLSYKSNNEAFSHACGHDFHAAVGLGLVKILKQFGSEGKYNYRILFQPAEEPIPSGASHIKDLPVITDIKMMFAIHVEPSLPVGTISFANGWVNAQSTKLNFIFKGPGGHSARPYQSLDILQEVAHFMQESRQFVQSISPPETPSVLVYTQIEGGNAYNVIPESVKLAGTLRTTKPALKERFLKFLEEYRKYQLKKHPLEITQNIISGAPPVVIKNDIFLSLSKIYNKFLKDDISWQEFRSMGGDDFGWYLLKVPGALIRIGIKERNSSTFQSLHSSGFDANDEALFYAMFSVAVFLLTWD